MTNSPVASAPSRTRSMLAIVSLLYGIVFITVYRFSGTIFTNWLARGFVILSMFGILGVLGLVSFIHFVINVRKNLLRAVLPLVINGLTFLIVGITPYEGSSQPYMMEYRPQLHGFNEIVDLVRQGTINTKEFGTAILSSQYSNDRFA
jgi:hypothetical protein